MKLSLLKPLYVKEKAYWWRGCISITGCFLIHLTLGSYFYSFGNLNTYLTSYLRARVVSNMDYSHTIWINAGVMVGQGLFMILGGTLDCKLGNRFTAILGCTAFSLSIWITRFTVEQGFVAVILSYGFLASSGLGIAYVVPLLNGMRWFPDKKGTVNGIIVAGYGLGALPMNYFQTAYLNPLNKQPNEEGYFTDADILDKVPELFEITAIIYAVIQLIAICLLGIPSSSSQDKPRRASLLSQGAAKSSPPEENVTDEGEDSDLELIPPRPAPKTSGLCPAALGHKGHMFTPSEMLCTKEFYMLWATFAFTAQSVQYTNTMYKAFGQRFIHNDKFLSTVGSLAALINCIGRVIWGLLLDRTSYKMCMLSLSAMLSFFMLTFSATPWGKEAMYTFWVLASYFTFSGLFVLFPTATAKVFGPEHCGTNFGILFTAPAFSSFVGSTLISIIQASFGFVYSFILVGCFSVIAFILTLFFSENYELCAKSR